MAKPLNVFSLNIRSLANDKKRRTVMRWLENNACKICFFQETFCQKNVECGANWTVKHNTTNSAHSRGVAIAISNTIDFTIENQHTTDDARAILLNCNIEGTNATLCTLYAPSGNDIKPRTEFFKKMKHWINRHADYPDNIILGGDFNCALNDNDRTNDNTDASRHDMSNLIKYLKLTDSWYLNNDKPQYTYTTTRTGNKSRIDYIFVSEYFKHKVNYSILKHPPIKDQHKSVLIGVILQQNPKGPGYWKLNAQLLEIPEYRLIINKIYENSMNDHDHPGLNYRTRWQFFKIRVKEASIKFGILRAKKKKEYINNIQKDIDDLNKKADQGENIDINAKENLEKRLNDYYQEKEKGCQIRSKINWKNEGERSTSYFFNLEKNRQSNNVIKELKDKNGKICHKDDEILGIATDFYENLFSSKNISQNDIDNYLDQVNFENTLSDDQKDFCDEPITEKEVENVIKTLKTEKSPGSDGLTPEFYKTFWPLIKDLVMGMISETFQHGELPYSMRKALLALLFKKGDSTLLKNYRPISLTNYDYKIICFTLTNRLQKVIKTLIHDDQTGYIKGRYIGTNARLIQDYFEHCEKFDVPGILLFLDFEKAFDSVEWNFMISVLERFNFGNNFISWIKILYNNPTLSIKNNGWISKDIRLSRGVRQGCPLSALIFVLTVEIMAIKIRQNPNINGFQCGCKEIKTSMYADDASLLLSNLESMKYAIDTVNEFSRVAGPILNKEKTEGILLGPLKNTINKYETIKFSNEAIRVLGIYLGHNKNECNEKNWKEKINKMNKVFERWKHRHLTLFGKVLII